MAREAPVVSSAGSVLTSTKFNNQVILQLQHILDTVINGTKLIDYPTPPVIGVDVGDLKMAWANADYGLRWLLCDGRTIGNLSSGASVMDDQMLVLYEHLWNNSTNTELIIQTSAGSPTTRGATAQDDWNSNKRMPLPDFRGRVGIGMDDPSTNTAANRVTAAEADVLGGATGAETHTLTTAQMPNHTHATGGGNSFINGKAAAGNTYRSDSANAGTFSMATASTGSGNAHNNMQPYITINYFIATGAN